MSEKVLRLLTSGHAAGGLRVSVSRLRQLLASGQIRSVRDSQGHHLFVAEDIEALAAKRDEERRERERQRSNPREHRTTDVDPPLEAA